MTPGEIERQTMTARYLTPAETAKMIRQELKEAFQTTKFSVRMARGDSVTMTWTDGPTVARVKEIADKYDGKGFDGMIDLAYYIDGWMLNGKIIGTRCTGTEGSRGTVAPWGIIPPHDDAELVSLSSGYFSFNRIVSPDLARKCAAQIANYWGGVDYIPEIVGGGWNGGYTFANKDDHNRHVRPDLRTHDYLWGEMIHRAAENAARFVREALV